MFLIQCLDGLASIVDRIFITAFYISQIEGVVIVSGLACKCLRGGKQYYLFSRTSFFEMLGDEDYVQNELMAALEEGNDV